MIRRFAVRLVLITGGEPTLHSELPKITRMLKTTGATITLITNGSQLDPLLPLLQDSVDAYLLSLDTPFEATHRKLRSLDNFRRLLQYPAMIKARNPHVFTAFSCVLQKDNTRHVTGLYQLLSPLPIDGLFINVPEIKPRCFGRPDTPLPHIAEYTQLDLEEIAILRSQLQEIVNLDRHRGLLAQGERYFSECVAYFEYVKGLRPLPDCHPCSVPSHSVVIDEYERCLPCFYLPFSFPINELGDDWPNHPHMTSIRDQVLMDGDFRRDHCKFCLQFQV